MQEWLVVDGYNIIGAWPELQALKRFNFGLAREKLVEVLEEYAAYSGKYVIVVFDAHLIRGQAQLETHTHCTVVYTEAGETADECIERLVGEAGGRRVFVATSDYTEQRIAFGRGALRISARELLEMVVDAKRRVREQTREMKQERMTLGHDLTEEVRRELERIRREH
ncbi:NYN domain-containing protein [Numidum massiliense]|uniref:NYN domain-containing protein n=1 Tax=Numidum massiliense TaxID=1522315 RepID=UPI0006D587F7|nr:NYN domain-containing protein [Numidum massiliense]